MHYDQQGVDAWCNAATWRQPGDLACAYYLLILMHLISHICGQLFLRPATQPKIGPTTEERMLLIVATSKVC